MSYNTDPATAGLSGYAGKSTVEIQSAMDDAEIYLNARYYPWPGKIASTTQAASWGRVSSSGGVLTDVDGRDLVGIPNAILQAEIVAAKLIMDGGSLLATTVATASSTSTTAGGQLTHKEVQAGSVTTVQKYSAASSDSTSNTGTVQEIDDNGFPIIKRIDAILWPIISVKSAQGGSNFYLLRA